MCTARVPDNRRTKGEDGTVAPCYVGPEDVVDDFGQKGLYSSRDEDAEADEAKDAPGFPISERFLLVAYTDASFAVTDKLQSISGWVVYLNKWHANPHTGRSGWAWKKKLLFIYNPIIIKYGLLKC